MNPNPYEQYTDEEITRKVAEELGWTEIVPIETFTDGYHGLNHFMALEGVSPTGEENILPEFATDLNAAFSLISNYHYQIKGDAGEGAEIIHYISVGIGRAACNLNIARGICIAWLIHNEAATLYNGG